jgi:hypothetical protein
MKKLILALLTVGTVATANAQEPRSILLYGNVGLHQVRAANLDKTTTWTAAPGVGYQFNHNWAVGGAISWGQDALKSSNGDKTTDNMYTAGAFARYSQYIRRSEIFFWFAQYEFAYAGGYTTQGGNPATNKHSGIMTRLYPAIGVNVGRGIAMNFSVGGLGYATDKGASATYSRNTLDFNFGRFDQFNFGLSKNFNCGHKMHAHHEPGDEIHRRMIDKMEDEDDAAPKPKRKQRSRDEDE